MEQERKPAGRAEQAEERSDDDDHIERRHARAQLENLVSSRGLHGFADVLCGLAAMIDGDSGEASERRLTTAELLEQRFLVRAADDGVERIDFFREQARDDLSASESEAFVCDHGKADEQASEQGIHEVTACAKIIDGGLQCRVGGRGLLSGDQDRVHVRSRSCK